MGKAAGFRDVVKKLYLKAVWLLGYLIEFSFETSIVE